MGAPRYLGPLPHGLFHRAWPPPLTLERRELLADVAANAKAAGDRVRRERAEGLAVLEDTTDYRRVDITERPEVGIQIEQWGNSYRGVGVAADGHMLFEVRDPDGRIVLPEDEQAKRRRELWH